jgi:hypothetical protein
VFVTFLSFGFRRGRVSFVARSPEDFDLLDSEWFMACPRPLSALSLQIRTHDFDQFLGGLSLWRVLAVFWRENMKAHMTFHYLSHQTVECTTAGCHQLQDTCAFRFRLQGALNGVDLSPDAANTNEQFVFLFCSVSHAFSIL